MVAWMRGLPIEPPQGAGVGRAACFARVVDSGIVPGAPRSPVKNVKGLVFAVAVAFVATLMQCRYVAHREKELLELSELKPTLVATTDIPEHFRLDETMVRVEQVPAKWRQPKALSQVDDILGQITRGPIAAGEQILASKLVMPNDAGLAYFVHPRFRAVAIAVDEFTAVGGHIRPGNYVDILGTFDFGQGEKADTRTVTLFQNVEVMSVGDDIGQPTARVLADEDAPRENRARGLAGGRTITVSVMPDEAQKLVLAQQLGDITLTLRSIYEEQRFVEVDHATIHNTLGIPQRVRYRKRPSYRVIAAGGY